MAWRTSIHNTSRYLVESDWLATHLDDADLHIVGGTPIDSPERTDLAKSMCCDRQLIPSTVFLDIAGKAGGFTDPDRYSVMTMAFSQSPGAWVGGLAVLLIGIGSSVFSAMLSTLEFLNAP